MQVAGVDGCPGGWVIVRVDASEHLRLIDVSISPTFLELVASTRDCIAVGIDVPIGLPDTKPRIADALARQKLGPRRNSVFPAPYRRVIEAATQNEASALSRAIDGKGVSAQNFAFIKAKVREANHYMTPALQERISEVHPEVCFLALNENVPLLGGKKSPAGALQRIGLIKNVLDFELEQTVVAGKVALDDFLDACAAAWTAGRIACGTAERLPPDPDLDSTGLRMEIVY